MKIVFLLVILICLPVIHTYAKKPVNGYYITQKNDTVRGTFLVPFGLLSMEPDYESLQRRVKFLEATGKKYTLSPKVIKAFVLDLNGKPIIFLSREHPISGASPGRLFLRLKLDGYLKIFDYYFTTNGGPMLNGAGGFSTGTSFSSDKFYLQKGDGPLTRMRNLFFKKDMSEFVSDCPELVQKIQNKEYRNEDLETIVSEYNKWIERRASPVN